MKKTRHYYRPIIITVITMAAIIALFTFKIIQAQAHDNLVNQETIAYEQFKTTPQYHYQRGYKAAYAEIIEEMGKLSYNPAYLPPERKPAQ